MHQQSCLTAKSWVYTQITNSSFEIKPEKHGYNRDAVLTSLISPVCAVSVVADGCALRYWSEVTAKVAVHKFVSYMETLLSDLKDRTVHELKEEMIKAVIYTNEQLLTFTHPTSHERILLEENGGQTTLAAALVFPFLSGEWGVITISMGDSEALLYQFEGDKGSWKKLSDDKGIMLPFMNLNKSQITKPVFQKFDNQGSIFVLSDGVRSSFVDQQLPLIPIEVFVDKTNFIGDLIICETVSKHSAHKTHPDDVCIGVIRPKNSSDETPQDSGFNYPYRETPLDFTLIYYPDFKEYNRNLVSEFIDLNESKSNDKKPKQQSYKSNTNKNRISMNYSLRSVYQPEPDSKRNRGSYIRPKSTSYKNYSTPLKSNTLVNLPVHVEQNENGPKSPKITDKNHTKKKQ